MMTQQMDPRPGNDTHTAPSAPQTGPKFRLEQQVSDALKSIGPAGVELDSYFGITSGKPKQTAHEAVRSDSLIQELQRSSSEQTDLTALLGKIADHNASSEIDPDALRALMKGSKKDQ